LKAGAINVPNSEKSVTLTINAGETAQIFNSVIYPSYHYDLPLLGIDFLSFGKKKILVVLDFQPLFRDRDYLGKYIEPMRQN
jgi:15,16-dihydrobiliverdin:ferredoxin oxidoreductase